MSPERPAQLAKLRADLVEWLDNLVSVCTAKIVTRSRVAICGLERARSSLRKNPITAVTQQDGGRAGKFFPGVYMNYFKVNNAFKRVFSLYLCLIIIYPSFILTKISDGGFFNLSLSQNNVYRPHAVMTVSARSLFSAADAGRPAVNSREQLRRPPTPLRGGAPVPESGIGGCEANNRPATHLTLKTATR